MKKLLSLTLLMFVLLASCTNPDNSGVASGGNPEFIILSSDILSGWGQEDDGNIPDELYDYVFIAESFIRRTFYAEATADILSFEFEGSEETTDKYAMFDKAGIIDKKEKLDGYIQKSIEKKFSDLYSEDFFEENVIIYVSQYIYGSVFNTFEYDFDGETKILTVKYKETPKPQGIIHSEVLHTYDYLIKLPKSAITINGKQIPYEEMTFRFVEMTE